MVDRLTAQVSSQLSRFEKELLRTPEDAVEIGLLVLKRSVERERDRAVGADGRLSNVGSRGAKLGAGFDIFESGRAHAKGAIQARGPWPLVENEVAPHIIGAKRLGTRGSITRRAGGGRGSFGRLRRAQAVNRAQRPTGARRGRAISYSGLPHPVAYVRHPGIRESSQPQPWRKGIRKGTPHVQEAMVERARTAAVRGWRGRG